MKTMNIILAAALALAAGSASALDSTGTAFAGLGCQGEKSSTAGFRYCTAVITSGSTVAQLGKQTIYPNKQIYLVGGVSGTTLSAVVTPTVSFYLGNRIVAKQDISVTTAGNVVNLGSVPYFNAISISASAPSTISATNAVIFSVIENDK